MNLIEINMNLFNIGSDYALAHCISSDCKMGAGIAVEFQNRFNLRNQLLSLPHEKRAHPTCVRINRVYNLITKEWYYQKPTLETVRGALLSMREQLLENGVEKLAMPRIGSGLDGLPWLSVKEVIEEVFKDTNIEIRICYL